MINSHTDTAAAKHSRPSRRLKKVLIIVLSAVAAIAVALGGGIYWMYTSGRSSIRDNRGEISTPESLVDAVEDDGMTVEYGGVRYRYNEDVVSLLFIGVDKNTLQDNLGYGQNGQADSLFIATLDTKAGTVRVIPLPRESMVDVNMVGISGGYAGTEKAQLCLAYAYGNTGEESSENVARSVSRLLYGMPVDAYVAVDIDGVQVITDAVGGVPITVRDSFSYQGHTFRAGENVTLNGKEAILYTRYRAEDMMGSTQRLKRQQQFLEAFFQQVSSQIKKDFTLLSTYYSKAKPYIVSDLSLSEITYLASSVLFGAGSGGVEYLSISGEVTQGEKYVEFYPEETSVYETVLKAFYKPVTE